MKEIEKDRRETSVRGLRPVQAHGLTMRKTLAAVFLCAAVSGAVCAPQARAQQARVAVAPFTATSGNAASDAETIAEIFGFELQAKNVVRVYTRGSIAAIMSEHRFQMSDLSSDEKTARLGKAANADWVVRGQVQRLGALIVVTASILDVNTLEILSGAPMYLNSIEEVAVKMDGFITTITTRLGGSGGSGGSPSAASHMEKGKVFYDRGDYDTAIVEFTEAIRLDPNYAEAYLWRGRAYNEKDDNDRAIADYTQAIRINPNNAGYYFWRGLASGDNDRAIADFTQAIRLDPDDAGYYHLRGNKYYMKDDYDRAIADYTQALRLDPNYTRVYDWRGDAYLAKGDYDRAIADYTQLIRLYPDSSAHYYRRGEAYRAKRDYDRAIADFTQAIRINPNDANAKAGLELARKRGR